MWARLHVATGLSKAEFEDLDNEEIDAIERALEVERETFMWRRSDLYALLCNIHAPRKGQAWKADDFMPKKGPEIDQESPEAVEALDAYRSATSR